MPPASRASSDGARPGVRLPAGLLAGLLAALLLGGCAEDGGGRAQQETTGPGPAAATPGAGPTGQQSPGLDPDGRPAEELLADARAAAASARSVHLVGEVVTAGEGIALDVRIGEPGAAGTVTIAGQEVELRRVGDSVYLRAAVPFWEAQGGAGVAGLVGDRWFLVPQDEEALSGFAAFTTVEGVVAELLAPQGEVRRGEVREVAGQRAVALVTEGEQGASRLWVSADDDLPLRVEAPEGGAHRGTVEFREWGEPVEVEAPPPGEVVTVEELASAATS